MRAAVITFSKTKEYNIREMITASACAGAEETELWSFNDCGKSRAADRYLPALEKEYDTRNQPELLVFAAGTVENELAARLAYRLAGSCALAVTDIKKAGDDILVKRRVWGLQAEGEFRLKKTPCIITITEDIQEPTEDLEMPEAVTLIPDAAEPDWYTAYTEEKPENADMVYPVVLAGGRGLGSLEEAENLRKLASRMQAGIGGTRPAVLSGWFSKNDMIGLSGRKVSPDLCIVFGASGCVPFMGGIDKKTVVAAINSDPNALIFKYSDIGIVDDCNAVMKSFSEILEQEEQRHG